MAITQGLNIQAARIPQLLRCPISLELMKDPVTLSTGLTYDRSSIEKWFDEGHRTCPATMQVVSCRDLVPNHTLRRLIQEWCVANKSRGVERIPTPKQPLEPLQARQMLQVVSEQDSRRKTRALRSLRGFAMDSEKNRKCISEAGAVRVLLNLIASFRSGSEYLRTEEVECCEEAVSLVSVLPHWDDDENLLIKLVTGSALPETLSWMINTRTPVSQIGAARLVERLAIDDETKSCLGATRNLIPGLVKMLRESSSFPRGLKASVSALLQIVSFRKNWVRVAESGVVPPLIELLPEATRLNTERALGVLEFLARCAEGRAALTEHKLCVPMLVKIILTVSDIASERAVGILWTMSQADSSILQAAANEGAFTQMVLLIQADNTLQTSQRARELLKLLRSVVSHECLHDFAFTMPF